MVWRLDDIIGKLSWNSDCLLLLCSHLIETLTMPTITPTIPLPPHPEKKQPLNVTEFGNSLKDLVHQNTRKRDSL